MMMLDLLLGWTFVVVFLALAFSAWRCEHAAGTAYSWQFGNLIACSAATFWSVAVFHAIFHNVADHFRIFVFTGLSLVAAAMAVMFAYGCFELLRLGRAEQQAAAA